MTEHSNSLFRRLCTRSGQGAVAALVTLDRRSPLLWGIIRRVWFTTGLTPIDLWLRFGHLATRKPDRSLLPLWDVQITDGPGEDSTALERPVSLCP